MAKTICISREAHDRLKDLRRDGETFSETILRASEEFAGGEHSEDQNST